MNWPAFVTGAASAILVLCFIGIVDVFVYKSPAVDLTGWSAVKRYAFISAWELSFFVAGFFLRGLIW